MPKKRKTTDEPKDKTLIVKLSTRDHAFIKILATERGLTIGRFVLEAIRHYKKECT